eukprot:340693-Amphidinium_carterae.1
MGAGQATMTIGDAKKATVAAHDMFLLLDRQSKIDCWEPTGSTPSFSDVKSAGQIEFKDVRFRYPFRPDVEVLKGLSFEVAQGEAVGLVGPSGSGKSTVMALIQRFYDPDSGSLLIGPSRETLSSLNIRWWRKQLGFVGQEPILFNTTVRSNVAYGLSEGETPSEDWLQKCVQMSNLVFLDKEAEGLDTQSLVTQDGQEVGPGAHDCLVARSNVWRFAEHWSEIPLYYCSTRPPAPWILKASRLP